LELMDYAPEDKRDEYLEILKDQSVQLRKLVEDILDLSRLSMEKAKKVEFKPVDIAALTQQIMAAHGAMAEVSGITLEYEAENGLPEVWGDENQLARVITNLVSNALRYTPAALI